MNTISPNSVVDALKWRYSTKKFDPARKIPAEIWAGLEQALVLTPSSFGLQPWKFIVVQDPAVRVRLSAASFGQTQPLENSHFVVFALRKGLTAADVDRHIDRVVEVRGGTHEKLQGYRNAMVGSAEKARAAGHLDVWSSRQVYIALGQFMAAAAMLGVDTAPMEGIEPAQYDEILGLAAQGFGTLCACAAGYRSADDKYSAVPKVRFKTGEVVTYV